MQLIRGLEQCPVLDASVVTIGNFDGIHLGHTVLINALKTQAQAHHVPSVLVSFYPHPSRYFGIDIPLLTGLREKVQLLKQQGIDYLLLMHFTEQFANLSAEQFIAQILVEKLSAQHIVIGDDFKFGQHAQGNVSLLAKHIPTTALEAQVSHDGRISSSNIRTQLASGDVLRANALLGYTYYLSGRVVRGLGLGSTIGVPTANINIKNRTLSLSGVFRVQIELGHSTYHGVMNIGKRPTIGDHLKTSVEVHIFDFDQEIYGELVTVRVLEKIRAEQKFANVEDLVLQIKKDIAFAKTKV